MDVILGWTCSNSYMPRVKWRRTQKLDQLTATLLCSSKMKLKIFFSLKKKKKNNLSKIRGWGKIEEHIHSQKTVGSSLGLLLKFEKQTKKNGGSENHSKRNSERNLQSCSSFFFNFFVAIARYRWDPQIRSSNRAWNQLQPHSMRRRVRRKESVISARAGSAALARSRGPRSLRWY